MSRWATSAISEYATAPLEQALPAADVLTLHVPLTPETRGLIGERSWP